MYCSNCGSLVNENLNYCKSCGGKVVKDNDGEQTKPMLNTLVTSVGFIGVLGLGILVGLVGVLLKNSVPNDVVGIIVAFYLATLFGICFSLIRLMSKLIDANVGKKTDKIGTSQTPQLAQPPTPQLNEYHQPVRSVTEHTTRNFENIESKI